MKCPDEMIYNRGALSCLSVLVRTIKQIIRKAVMVVKV
jgi:hypothetical protein